MFREVRKAVEQGDRARAKDILTRALRRDPDDATIWLWMSAVVDTPKERAYCLREVLRIDPENVAARRGLNLMGELPPESGASQLPRQRKRNWQVELERAERPPVQTPWRKIVAYGGAGIVALGLILFAIIGPNASRNRAAAPAPQAYRPFPTMTYTITVTPTVTPTPNAPTPPWQALPAAYTPTPLYVNTPHPLIEAYGLAIRAIQRAEWDKGIEYLNQTIQNEPDSPDLHYLLGEVYRLSGRYPEAAAAYENALRLNQAFAPAYLGRALNQWSIDAGQVDQIRADLETALQLDPQMPETLTKLGLLALSTGDPQTAVEHFNAAEARSLAFPITYYYRARAYLQLNDADAALADAERAAQSDVTMLPAYLTLGEALQANQRLADSIVPLEIYLRYASPPDPAAYYKIGVAYHAAGDLDAAIDALDKILAEVPESVASLLERGLIYLERNEPEKALADFDAALALDPASFDGGIGRSRALIASGAYSDAVDQLNQLLTAELDEAQQYTLYYWRAQALEPLNPADATIDWERLLAAPEGLLPAEWIETAQMRLSALYTPTPG